VKITPTTDGREAYLFGVGNGMQDAHALIAARFTRDDVCLLRSGKHKPTRMAVMEMSELADRIEALLNEAGA
tara:strand:- start:363 stop:578 length:216 start_codon:yes stop_codon:yes gene_type:complete